MAVVERWKAVRGHEGLYDVSDRGRVRSLNYHREGRVQVMKPFVTTDGYFRVLLSFCGKGKKYLVHVLVLESFVEPRPKGLVCDHIDSNPANNHFRNLRWITSQENTLRGRLPEIMSMRVGSKHPNSKLTEGQAVEIRRRYAAGGVTQRELGLEYGMTKTSIGDIIRRKIWKHV